jgi:hypothetical protein
MGSGLASIEYREQTEDKQETRIKVSNRKQTFRANR